MQSELCEDPLLVSIIDDSKVMLIVIEAKLLEIAKFFYTNNGCR